MTEQARTAQEKNGDEAQRGPPLMRCIEATSPWARGASGGGLGRCDEQLTYLCDAPLVLPDEAREDADAGNGGKKRTRASRLRMESGGGDGGGD